MLTEVKTTPAIEWLLEGDAAIAYQTLRDLADAPSGKILSARKKITTTGWGKQLLDLQQADGSWSGKLYSPKWTSTFYTLLLLTRLGMIENAQTKKALQLLFDQGFYTDGGLNFWKSWKHGETCVTGMFLSMVCHFNFADVRREQLVHHLLQQQMPDGGWNCESYNGATHSSFHTTLSVLEGLWEYQKMAKPTEVAEVEMAQQKGIEFLLQHRLYRSHRTGNIVDHKMTLFSFPPRWKYDVLKALDYMQAKNVARDERFSDAIQLLEKKKTEDGFWKLENKHPGKIFFDLEKQGQPSRWNTLRALRVLRWWNGI